MKTLLCPVRCGRRRAGRTAARAKAYWSRRIMSAWLLFVGRILFSVVGRAGRDRQAGEWIMPAWLDGERELLLAIEVRAA